MIRKIEIPVTSGIYEMTETIYAHPVVGTNGETMDLKMALILPKAQAKAPRPVLLWLPGGGWMESNPLKWMPSLVYFAKKGYGVASAQYRLCTQGSFPAQIIDAKTAVRFLRANADQYGFDPDRIGVLGCSAGGLLASMTAMNEEASDAGAYCGISSGVSAAAVLYGPSDLPALSEEASVSASGKGVLYAGRLLLGGDIHHSEDKARAFSPIFHIGPGTCPILLAHGTNDQVIPVSQSVNFYAALQKAGVESELYLLEGAGHSTPEFAQEAFKSILLGFFDRHLKSS